MSPSLLSKLTTLVQLITVFAVLIESDIAGLGYVEGVLFWTAAGLTILSGLHYIYIGLNILQGTPENTDSIK